jgi:hypothetical protein
LNALDCISSATGINVDYILYGKTEKNKLQVKQNLHNIIDMCDKEELKMYYKCITTIKDFVNKSEK